MISISFIWSHVNITANYCLYKTTIVLLHNFIQLITVMEIFVIEIPLHTFSFVAENLLYKAPA